MSFFRLIRLPNLFIVALTQSILFYRIIMNALEQANITPIFDDFHFTLMVITTICITAGSYIANDIIDLEIDKINKPNKVIIGKTISIQTTYWLTGVIYLMGFIIAVHLSMYAMKRPYLMIYPFAVAGLLAYNIRLKGRPLVGNLIVSLYTAGVAAIIWLAESPSLDLLFSLEPSIHTMAWQILFWFMVFAFLSNLMREIVKDIEDMKGDSQGKLQTLPIVIGEKRSKIFVLVILAVLLIFIAIYAWHFLLAYDQIILVVCSGILFLLLLVIAYLLFKAKSKSNYHQISQLLKVVMVVGLVLLLCFKI